MGYDSRESNRRDWSFIGSGEHVQVSLIFSTIVALLGYIYQPSKIPEPPVDIKAEETALAKINAQVQSLVDEEKRLMFAQARLKKLDATFSDSAKKQSLSEQINDMDQEYARVQKDLLQQQQRYQDLMYHVMATPAISEVGAKNALFHLSNALSSIGDPMKAREVVREEYMLVAYRNECLIGEKETLEKLPVGQKLQKVMPCMEEEMDKHSNKVLGGIFAVWAGLGLASYAVPVAAQRLRRNRPQERKSTVTVVERFDP